MSDFMSISSPSSGDISSKFMLLKLHLKRYEILQNSSHDVIFLDVEQKMAHKKQTDVRTFLFHLNDVSSEVFQKGGAFKDTIMVLN